MRANKGLGRTAARNLRLDREAVETEANENKVSPYHARVANKLEFRPSNRVSNVVVYEHEVNQLIESLGRRLVTARKRRVLANRLYNQKLKASV